MKSLFIALLLVSSVLAQTDTGLITVRRSSLPASVIQQVEMQQKIETMGKWVGLGKEIGTAVKEGLSALTEETDKFSKTGVGKFTMFMIAFKIMGYAVIQLCVGIILFLIITPVIIVSFFKNCMPEKYVSRKNSDGSTEHGITKPNPNQLWCHVTVFFLFLFVLLAIIFIH